MRRLGWLVVAVAVPAAASAEETVIRIEAKRSEAAAQQAAEGWAESFDNVVTFPLRSGWIGIALGPYPAETADAQLSGLKTAGKVPADSFVTVYDGNVPLAPFEPAAMRQDVEGVTVTEIIPDTEETPQTGAEPVLMPEYFIRLQSLPDQVKGKEALATWRKEFPEAGMWELPNGWFGIAVGPLGEAEADAWMTAFRQAGVIPKDAFLSERADMGVAVEKGETVDWPEPGQPQVMPPVSEVQEILSWVGLYDGAIDGQAGPKTREAINAAIAGQRQSPDAATVIRNLFGKREQWRGEFGLTVLENAHTGLRLTAPMKHLQHDRNERALSIYGPKNDSGAALILFSQPGGQQELLDLSGLVTALGWVPQPKRDIGKGHVLLDGQDEAFSGFAEGWVRDGRAEGFVLVWPAHDTDNRARIVAEIRESLTRYTPDADADAGETAEPAVLKTLPVN